MEKKEALPIEGRRNRGTPGVHTGAHWEGHIGGPQPDRHQESDAQNTGKAIENYL